MRTLVIAEPGCTAEGDYGAMVRLIHAAKQADADVFKAQWTSDPDQMCARRHITPEHPKYAYYRQAYGWLNFDVEWHRGFANRCKELGMQYACTSFLPQDVATVDPFVSIHKVSSFEQGDRSLIDTAATTGKPVIVSHGASIGMPIYSTWIGREADIYELHCVSAYPAPVDEMNLSAVGIWADGLSDHSRDIDMGGFAVCAGASVVEAHLRLYDCSPANPDYPAAFDPGEFAMYVAKIRKAERAMGDGVKRVQPSEEWALPYKVTA